jgi:hypothetical protein
MRFKVKWLGSHISQDPWMYIQYGISKWLFLIEIPFKNKKLQQSVYCCDFCCLFIEFAAVSSSCGFTFIWHWKTPLATSTHTTPTQLHFKSVIMTV